MHPRFIRFAGWLLCLCAGPVWLHAQAAGPDDFTRIPLEDLRAFQNPPANWKIAGSARAELDKDNVLTTGAGTGILVNLPDANNRGNLTFLLEHGDADIELEFMMARHSNSGIYLQGRYEVQLYDSWGVANPTFSDCGGIYQRWDDAAPEGQKGYQGYAPRVNAARAPGLWQKLHIAFQAPRFDAVGRKTANARILRIELNGSVLHENLELTGPTRGPAFPGESALGPLFIQGDHGPVAFRNIRYRLYDQPAAKLDKLEYAVYQGDFQEIPDLSALKPQAGGKTAVLTQELARMNEKMLLRFTGILKTNSAGSYGFQLTSFGSGMLRVDGKTVIPFGWWDQKGRAELPVGDLPIEIIYVKRDNWFPNGLALNVEGPGFRSIPLQTLSSLAPPEPEKPIRTFLGTEPVVLRSFIDFATNETDSAHQIVRAVSVGFPEKTCFTYNLANGALVQAWKGGFLDATPMWHSRGDGSARPDGTVLRLDDTPFLFIADRPGSPAADTVPEAAAFCQLGYTLDNARIPTFDYQIWGAGVSDRMVVEKEGKLLTRTLQITGTIRNGLHGRLASGKTIETTASNRYIVDGRYYLDINNAGGGKPLIINTGGHQELIVPLTAATTLSYSLLW